MSTIPLPALATAPPPNPADQIGKVLQLKSMLQNQQLGQEEIVARGQENQQRQMALQDMQTIQKIAPDYVTKDANGKATGYDFDALEQGAIAAGVHPQSLSQLQAMRKNASDILFTQAQTNAKNIESQQKVNDQFRGHLEAVRAAAPEDRQSTYQDALTWAQQQKLDTSHLPKQIPTDDQSLNPWLDQQEAKLAMGSQLISEAKDKAQTAKDAADAGLAQIKLNLSKNSKPGDFDSQIDAIAPPKVNPALNARTKSMVNFALGRGDIDSANAAIKQANEQVNGLQKEAYVQGQENLRQDHNRQAQMSNELQKAGLNKLDQMFTDPQHGYTQFLAQANSTKSALEDAKDGNEFAASMAPLMTVLGINSFAGIHRVNPQEIAAAGPKVGSLYRQANSILDKAMGGNINEDTRKEMVSVIDGLVDAKHASLLPAANLVAQNAGLDPTKTSVLDKAGNVTTLDKVAGTKPTTPTQPKVTPTGKSVSLAAARQLPQNKGKTDEQIKADIESFGHTVVP